MRMRKYNGLKRKIWTWKLQKAILYLSSMIELGCVRLECERMLSLARNARKVEYDKHEIVLLSFYAHKKQSKFHLTVSSSLAHFPEGRKVLVRFLRAGIGHLEGRRLLTKTAGVLWREYEKQEKEMKEWQKEKDK